VLGRHRRYLEIGAAAAAACSSPRRPGAERIVGVEINPDHRRHVAQRFPGYGVGPLVADPRRSLIAGEGRGTRAARRSSSTRVTITFIQTGSPTARRVRVERGESVTGRSVHRVMGRLEPNGLFYVYRTAATRCWRLLAIVARGAEKFGVDDPRQHLFAARNDTNRAALWSAARR